MQPVVVDPSEIAALAVRLWWPVLRIAGFVAAAPIVGAGAVPARVKVVLTLAIAFLLAPSVAVPPALSIFSAAGILSAAQELMVGVAIGMVVQLAFDALAIAGQTIATSMGLGFATLVDPQRGANTTVLGQLFVVFATLAYLALDGHLLLLGELANSYRGLPIGATGAARDLALAVASRGGWIFETGLLIALPAVVSLIIVNVALGVVARAAPQLNLFGIGFPLTLLAGYAVLFFGMSGVMSGITSSLREALAAVAQMTSAPSAGVP
jgi:flagellar biosynthetic protein FliR